MCSLFFFFSFFNLYRSSELCYTLFSMTHEECKRKSGESCDCEVFDSILKQTPHEVMVWSTASGGHLSLGCEKWLILISFKSSIIFLFLWLLLLLLLLFSPGYISTSPSNSTPLYTKDLNIFSFSFSHQPNNTTSSFSFFLIKSSSTHSSKKRGEIFMNFYHRLLRQECFKIWVQFFAF